MASPITNSWGTWPGLETKKVMAPPALTSIDGGSNWSESVAVTSTLRSA
ncbi:MAG: hypothetical protein OEW46_11965 [Actinomycetota bacterium]|nr:hypothetical protein [Actinomycetota bacterium]